jgi:hypothetical protein
MYGMLDLPLLVLLPSLVAFLALLLLQEHRSQVPASSGCCRCPEREEFLKARDESDSDCALESEDTFGSEAEKRGELVGVPWNCSPLPPIGSLA